MQLHRYITFLGLSIGIAANVTPESDGLMFTPSEIQTLKLLATQYAQQDVPRRLSARQPGPPPPPVIGGQGTIHGHTHVTTGDMGGSGGGTPSMNFPSFKGKEGKRRGKRSLVVEDEGEIDAMYRRWSEEEDLDWLM